jgi:hypothetical protein
VHAPAPGAHAELADAARTAAHEHAAGRGGRAVQFRGRDRLVGSVTVADTLAASAIERIKVLGAGSDPAPGTILLTQDFVRPQWMEGRLTLVAMPAAGGRIVPFEVRNPRGCCSDH